MKMLTPKVSVIIPCYNVEKYLRECLDSVVNQTLREIQIICVNDGSTDSTLSILEEYASRDERIEIINKANSGYGNSMNRGFDQARGEYLGIVESDDFAEPHMFETLYHAAVKNNLDVAKAGFYQYSTTPRVHNEPVLSAAKMAGKNVFCPMTHFRDPQKKADFFMATAAIWAGIYRRDFIREHGIRFNETAGASYQDVGFCFKVWFKAKRVQFLDTCLLHYRIDNSQSSVHNPGKVYCICDEYAELDRYTAQYPQEKDAVMPVMLRMKYESYLWNYERLAEQLQQKFVHRFYQEFRQHQEKEELCRSYFSWYDWNNLQKLLLDPNRYHEIQSKKLRGEDAPGFYDAYPEHRPFKFKALYYLAENMAGAWNYLGARGASETLGLLLNKARKKVSANKTEEKESV